MSLDKAIKHGKEKRKGYAERGKPGRYDTTCRPHGGGSGRPCTYCERNRLFARTKLDSYDGGIENVYSETIQTR